jgi:hypothetical protein
METTMKTLGNHGKNMERHGENQRTPKEKNMFCCCDLMKENWQNITITHATESMLCF